MLCRINYDNSNEESEDSGEGDRLGGLGPRGLTATAMEGGQGAKDGQGVVHVRLD